MAVCLHALQRPWRLNKRDDGNLIYCSLHTQWHLSKEFVFYTGFKVVVRMKYDCMSTCFCDILGTLSGPVVLWGPRSDLDPFFLPSWLVLESRIRVRLSLGLGRNWLGYTHRKKKSMLCPNNDSCKNLWVFVQNTVSRGSTRSTCPLPWRQLEGPSLTVIPVIFFVWFPSVSSSSWMSLQQMTSGWWLGVSSASHVAPSKLQRIYSFSCVFLKQWCPLKETTISFK